MLNLQHQPDLQGRGRLQEVVVFAKAKAFEVINIYVTALTRLGGIDQLTDSASDTHPHKDLVPWWCVEE